MRLLGSAVLLIMLLAAACGGNQAAIVPDSQGQDATTAPADYGLPAPSAISHTTSANSTTQLDASEFLATHYDHVLDIGTTAEFMPNWPTSGNGDPYQLAWAVYPFTIDTAEQFIRVELDWHSAPVGWIGVSDFSTDSWNWSQGSAQADLPGDLSDCVDEGDVMYVLVAVYGVGTFLLNELNLIEQTGGGSLENLFFLHHSTGQGIIDGGVRSAINTYNTAHSTSFEFWDHCYTYPSESWPGGLVDPDGNGTGTSYGDPCDATDPPDLAAIWTDPDPYFANVRNNFLNNHEVIAFKSCFPASAISSNDMLDEYKGYYLDMRDVFDLHTDNLFVVMSTPPLHPDSTNAADALRARQFADWLKSSTYLNGHPNVVCFDLFDELASDGSDGPVNTLRTSYQPDWTDSHPNATGNAAVAPVFANFLCDSAAAYTP